MECELCRPQLTALLDGELTSEESARVNDHLAGCATCQAEYDSLHSTHFLPQRLSRQKLPDHLWPQIEARIQASAGFEQTGRGRWSFRGWWPAWAGLSAAAAVLAVVFLNPSPVDAPGAEQSAQQFQSFIEQRELESKLILERLKGSTETDHHLPGSNPFVQPDDHALSNPFARE